MPPRDSPPPDWNALRTLLAVYRAGSLAKAARLLGVDKATVSRHLAAVEAEAGVRLFARTAAGLEPTEAAMRVMVTAEAAEEQVLRFEREVRRGDARVSGVVRLTTGGLFGPMFVIPRLAEFHRAYPHVRVDLQVDTRTADLARRESDLAIRLYRPAQPSLVAKLLGRHRVGLFAAASYLREHGSPTTVAALAGHAVIAYDEAGHSFPEAKWLREHAPAARVVLESNDSRALLDACVAGLGLAVLPHYAARAHADLLPVLADAVLPEREIWMTTHRDVAGVARVRVLGRYLADTVRDGGSILRGRP